MGSCSRRHTDLFWQRCLLCGETLPDERLQVFHSDWQQQPLEQLPCTFQRGTEFKIKKFTDDNQGGANPSEQSKIFK